MDLSLMGGDMLALGVHFFAWTFLLLLIEGGCFNWVHSLLFLLPKNRIEKREYAEGEIDTDVIEEEKRVKESGEDMPVVLSNFRRIYPSLFRRPVLAVDRASFSLNRGDCFALLGVNGAGKTSTFRALTSKLRGLET